MKDKKRFLAGIGVGVLLCGLFMSACSGKKTVVVNDPASQPANVSAADDDGSENATREDKIGAAESTAIDGTNVTSTFLEEIDLSDRYDEIEKKLDQLTLLINKYYTGDGSKITEDDLIEGIYSGFIDALGEPYTTYYDEGEYTQLMEDTEGVYSGIGALLSQNINTGIVTVIRPFAGSPAAEAGILADDIVLKVDEIEITGMDLSEAVTYIRGKEGSQVNIYIYRPSEDKYYTFEVERRTIEVPMTEHRMMDDNIGYISIYEFEETTATQFSKAVADLESQGMEALIIDLRDNPGGLVDICADVLDRILPKDQLLVYTVNRAGKKQELCSDDDETIDVPIVLLVNEESASASEIMAGCLQDYSAATLVGVTTFGKGIVQYVIPLGDGTGVKLTSAAYYTPKNRNIHGVGIDPDVVVEDDPELEGDEQLNEGVEILKGMMAE